MPKSTKLLNPLLGLMAVLIAVTLVKTWVAPAAPVASPVVTKSLPEAEALAYNPTSRPPLTQFDVLLEKNPFKQPPPMPVRPQGASPPPPPLPILVGTILTDHERRAILSDKGKANIYAIGQNVAGGVITEIKEDRISYKRGDATRDIMLKAAIESASAAPAQASAPVASQEGAPAQASGPSQPPVAAGVSDIDERAKRRDERLRERRERWERRKAE